MHICLITDADSSLNVSQTLRGNITAKTTYQRSAKGPVNIGECSPDFITVENTGRKVCWGPRTWQ